MAKVKRTVDGSKYTGSAFATWGVNFASGFVSAISCGLAYPAMKCWKMNYDAKHTFINGKQLVFTGKAGELFKKYIIWWLLSIVTLGIYAAFVMPVKLVQWEYQNTHFEGENGESDFDGTAGQLIGLNIKTRLAVMFTLGIAGHWAAVKRMEFFYEHQIIDGKRLSFIATSGDYRSATAKWGFLNLITLGIYS